MNCSKNEDKLRVTMRTPLPSHLNYTQSIMGAKNEVDTFNFFVQNICSYTNIRYPLEYQDDRKTNEM